VRWIGVAPATLRLRIWACRVRVDMTGAARG
jgi:hypothetical protein